MVVMVVAGVGWEEDTEEEDGGDVVWVLVWFFSVGCEASLTWGEWVGLGGHQSGNLEGDRIGPQR